MTKPERATVPQASRCPPLHYPSKIPKNGASRKEIGRRPPQLRSPSPFADSFFSAVAIHLEVLAAVKPLHKPPTPTKLRHPRPTAW
uniref:Uncharacterized protein n=1 Tax=Oryza glumipatula TaxID=40148 RepID=A0A0E0A9Q3_9ORYZ